MEPYGVLIVGAGWVSGAHIRAFEQNPHARVVAICSRRAETARQKAADFQLSDCAVYTDVSEALRDPRVDIAVICTPNHLHCEQVLLAAEAGKHVLIEKPIALSYADALAMQAAIHKAGVRSLVGYVLHYNPLFVTAKKMQKDFIGDIRYAETDYFHRVEDDIPCYEWNRTTAVGGSSLLAGGCHAVDAMRWFMREEVVSVYAQTCRIREDFEFDGTAAVILKFANGAVGKVGSSYDFLSPYVFNVRLCGTKGTLWNDRLWSPGMIEKQQDYLQLPVLLPNSGDVSHHPFPEQAAHLIDCIRKGRETDCSIDDAVKTQEVIAAADLSAKTGKAVHLPLSPDALGELAR